MVRHMSEPWWHLQGQTAVVPHCTPIPTTTTTPHRLVYAPTTPGPIDSRTRCHTRHMTYCVPARTVPVNCVICGNVVASSPPLPIGFAVHQSRVHGRGEHIDVDRVGVGRIGSRPGREMHDVVLPLGRHVFRGKHRRHVDVDHIPFTQRGFYEFVFVGIVALIMEYISGIHIWNTVSLVCVQDKCVLSLPILTTTCYWYESIPLFPPLPLHNPHNPTQPPPPTSTPHCTTTRTVCTCPTTT